MKSYIKVFVIEVFFFNLVIMNVLPGVVDASETSTVEELMTLSLEDLLQIELVETGFARAKILNKSTISITALNTEELNRISITSNPAEVLKAIPGISVETSGNSDFNLMTRGFPQNFSPAGNIYMQLQEDGLPILENPLFVDPQYFSSGLGLARVEVVRGSTAGIWGTNSPGGLVNFITKEGGDEHVAKLLFTYGIDGLYQYEGHVSGPLANFDDVFYSLSGKYLEDDGVRSRDKWPLNSGGEIFGNIVKELKWGKLKISGKYKDKRAHQVRPGIVSFSSDSGFSELPEYDIREDNFVVNDFDHYSIPQPDGGSDHRNLRDGNHVRFYYVGAKLDIELTDWLHSTTQARYTSGQVSTDIDINLSNRSIQEYADEIKEQIGADTYRVQYLFDSDRVFTEENVDQVGGNGLWAPGVHITWDWDNSNIFLKQQFDAISEENVFSLAVYFSNFKRQRSGQFHNLFHEARGNPQSLDLIMVRNGEDIAVTDNGFAAYSTNNRDEDVESTVLALILEDEYSLTDRVDLSGAFRYENKDISNTERKFETVDLDQDPDTIYNNNYLAPTGEISIIEDEFSDTAYSFGINYQIDTSVDVFGRYSNLFLSRTEQDYLGLSDIAEVDKTTRTIEMYELGLKYFTRKTQFFSTLFFAQLRGIPFSQLQEDSKGNIVEHVRTGGSESLGLEISAYHHFNEQFNIDLTATWLDATYVDTFVCCDSNDLSIDVSGKQVIRQPEFNIRITTVWNINRYLEAYTVVQYFSERQGNETNTVEFDAYAMVDIGLKFEKESFYVKALVINVLDEAGQQEGSVQEGNKIGESIQNEITLGRFTHGITAQISIGYKF
ncbi:MAG: hypothetical protein COA99_09210 [Moraxellaceae bacterium]|nr:MAG: hypothetical protein COA99_09210 [Moraxellaceae bacterium]